MRDMVLTLRAKRGLTRKVGDQGGAYQHRAGRLTSRGGRKPFLERCCERFTFCADLR